MNPSKLSSGWSAVVAPTPSPLDSDRLYFMVDTTATDTEHRYPNFVDMVISGLTGKILDHLKPAKSTLDAEVFAAALAAVDGDPNELVKKAVWGEVVPVTWGKAEKTLVTPELRFGSVESTEHPAVKVGSSYFRATREGETATMRHALPLTFRVPLLREFTPEELACIKANAHRVAKLYGFEVKGFRYVLERVSRLQVEV